MENASRQVGGREATGRFQRVTDGVFQRVVYFDPGEDPREQRAPKWWTNWVFFKHLDLKCPSCKPDQEFEKRRFEKQSLEPFGDLGSCFFLQEKGAVNKLQGDKSASLSSRIFRPHGFLHSSVEVGFPTSPHKPPRTTTGNERFPQREQRKSTESAQKQKQNRIK